MQRPRHIATREYILHASHKAGLHLSDQRIDELVPMLQAILDGLNPMRDLVEKYDLEPAPTFRPLET